MQVASDSKFYLAKTSKQMSSHARRWERETTPQKENKQRAKRLESSQSSTRSETRCGDKEWTEKC